MLFVFYKVCFGINNFFDNRHRSIVTAIILCEFAADTHTILRRLSDGGNTVVVIEHNLDVIKTADYIIDIGPEGGDQGGTVIASGTPEEVAACPQSYTGQYVKRYLERK